MSKKKLIIYGNGSIAKMLFRYVYDIYDVVAFCVDKVCILEPFLESKPVVDFNDVEKLFPPKDHLMLIAVGFVQMNRVRALKYKEAKDKGYSLISYIHPTAVFCSSVEFGENVIILEFVSLHSNVKIGNNTFISSNSNIGHDGIIRDNCWINAGVSLAGGVTILDRCFLGINSSVAEGVKVGQKTFVGANTFISQDTDIGDVYLPSESTKFRVKSDKFIKMMNIS